MKISAMVLGEDKDYLKYCLESIKGIVDEIVMSDLRIDDFAEMRNDCLKRITGDWVLVLDSDEILANPDGSNVSRRQLEKLIEQAEKEGITGYHIFTLHFLYNYRMIDGSNNGQHYSYGRLYKREHIERYKGKIHELPVFKYGQNLKPTSEFFIWHFGHCKGMEYVREKYRRTMKIPGNPFKPEFERFKDTDEYCKSHPFFMMTKPVIFYYGPLPEVLKLW